jgi:hypothetical protein
VKVEDANTPNKGEKMEKISNQQVFLLPFLKIV